MSHFQLEPTERWMPMRLPPMTAEEAKRSCYISCGNCDKRLEPIVEGTTFYFECKDCSYCKKCGSVMHKTFESNSPACNKMIWVCNKCGVRK